MSAAITGLGLVTPLGCGEEALRRLVAGDRALRPHPELAPLPCDLAAWIETVDLLPWLQRRKDRKLLSRAAELGLPAAGAALAGSPGARETLGLFVGVGREPPDTGSSEPALAASCRAGRLDPAALAGPGRALYPPLLPLLTLPNLALSHISINLGIRGANGTAAGEAAAGLLALAEACWALAEGRCPAALAGACDSLVDFGSARDRARLGRGGPARAPSEGAVFLLLERTEDALAAGRPILGLVEPLERGPSTGAAALPHHPLLGDLGAADGLLALALALHAGRWGATEASDDEGGRARLWLEPPPRRDSVDAAREEQVR